MFRIGQTVNLKANLDYLAVPYGIAINNYWDENQFVNYYGVSTTSLVYTISAIDDDRFVQLSSTIDGKPIKSNWMHIQYIKPASTLLTKLKEDQ